MDASLVSSFRTYGLSELRLLMRTEDNLCICNQPTVSVNPRQRIHHECTGGD